jgi:hypothetical protein
LVQYVGHEIDHENVMKKWNDGTLEEDNGGKPCKSDPRNNLIKDKTSQVTTPRTLM